jgi:hypothetical protein
MAKRVVRIRPKERAVRKGVYRRPVPRLKPSPQSASPSPALPDPSLPPVTVSVHDAGCMLGLGYTSMWRLIRARALDTLYVGRKCLVTVQSINYFVAREAERHRKLPPRTGPEKATAAHLKALAAATPPAA